MINIKMSFNLTLALLKPDISKMPHILEVFSLTKFKAKSTLISQTIKNVLLSNNFYLIKHKRITINKTQAELFYEEHKKRFFYNRLIKFICSGPSEAYVLGGVDAISRWRTLMGPTKTFKAQFNNPESIRGRFGLTDTRNATHGSDSISSATREIQIIFPEFDLVEWYKEEMKYFNAGQVKFSDTQCIHIRNNK